MLSSNFYKVTTLIYIVVSLLLFLKSYFNPNIDVDLFILSKDYIKMSIWRIINSLKNDNNLKIYSMISKKNDEKEINKIAKELSNRLKKFIRCNEIKNMIKSNLQIQVNSNDFNMKDINIFLLPDTLLNKLSIDYYGSLLSLSFKMLSKNQLNMSNINDPKESLENMLQ